MAGFFDKLKTLVGVEDEEYLEDDFEEPAPRKTVPKMDRYTPRTDGFGLREDPTPIVRERSSDSLRRPVLSSVAENSKERGNVRAMPSDNIDRLEKITSQFKIVVIEPKGFDECPKLVDSLKARRPVIINLERLETDTARKIFDFLSGATYALNGNVQKIANNIFVFLPESVDVATNTDHKGITFGSQDGNPWKL